jgi:tetratricopeptide (TPR) repeat protein
VKGKTIASCIALALFLVFSLPAFSQKAAGLYEEGRKAQDQEHFYDAIDLFKSALDINSHYLEPLVGLAESYFALSEYDEALRYIERARRLDRLDTNLVGIEGRIRLGLGQFEESRIAFESILDIEPNNVDAQFGLAELAIAFGKAASAAALYENALRISPQNRRALLSLVLIFDETGDYEIAGEYLAQVLDYYPQNATVQYVAAKHMFTKGNFSEAEYHARVALSINSEYLEATLLLSGIHLVREEYAPAVEILLNVLAIHKDEALVWYNLAVAYGESGQTQDAIQAFARIFNIQPDDEVSRIALENLLLYETEIGDPLRERYAGYHFDRGKALLDRNYLVKAMLEFRRGLILTPRSREGRLLYASVYRLLGLEGKYYTELRVISDLGFDDREVRDKLEIAESLLRDSVSERWKVSQYDLERYRFQIAVYFEESKMLHILGDREAAAYLDHLLLGYDKIELVGPTLKTDTFGGAYRDARERAVDFFAVVSFDEGSRHFATGWKLYSGNTGAELAEHAVLRTGNNRVADALNSAADALERKLPFYGEILTREFDTAVIDAGWVDGIEIGDELLILQSEVLDRGHDVLGFVYAESEILGSMTIIETDELVCVGEIKKDPFFDLINIGDKVIYPPSGDEESSAAQQPIPDELYKSILKLR